MKPVDIFVKSKDALKDALTRTHLNVFRTLKC
jgi:hypothetical protein